MRRMAVAILLIAAVIAGWIAWHLIDRAFARKPFAATPPPVPVIAAVATRRDMPAIVPALGTVLSPDTVNVTPQVNGRIRRIYFKQGDEVRRGQLLFLIDPRPY